MKDQEAIAAVADFYDVSPDDAVRYYLDEILAYSELMVIDAEEDLQE